MSPETKELTVPPTSGLAPTLTPVDLKLPPAVTQCVPSMQPLVQFEPQLLAILSDIDATPSPVASPATATQQSVDESPLTARALRYHRRDAFRTDRNNVAPVPSPSSTDPLHALGAEMHEKDRLDFTSAPPRELLHPTIPNKIPPPAPSRAFRSISSSSTTSSAPKTAATGPRPSAPGTASACLAAQPGHPQGTSSRTHGLRPDSPVPPRAYMGDPYGPRHPPPTSATSTRSGTSWSLLSEPGLAQSPSTMRRPALR